MIKITTQEMKDFSRYLADISGILIDEGKKYLLENRLQYILATQKCSSFHELLFSAKNDNNIHLRSNVIDAITTNETYFFRDKVPFDILKYKIIPDIIDRKKRMNLHGKRQIRIWCAACSTGQEVYSVIMSILETVPDIWKYDIRVLGTDISNRVLAQASSGRYSRHEVERGLPRDLRDKYFLAEKGSWRVNDEVRIMADFKRMNLLEPLYGIGPFDIIFCRNVSIYFSEQNKVQMFKKIARILDKDGFLIVGGSESLSEVAPQFSCHRHLKGMYYQRKEASSPISVKTKPQVQRFDPVPANRAVLMKKVIRPLSSPVVHAKAKSDECRIDVTRRIESPTAGMSDQDSGSGDFQQKKPLLPVQNNNPTQVIDQKEEPCEKTISQLIADKKNAGVEEQKTLLGSILDKHHVTNSPLHWQKMQQGEQRKSLLEIIQEKNEVLEQDDGSKKNE